MDQIASDLGNEYEKFELIGKGAFASVYSAYEINSLKEKVAIKQIILDELHPQMIKYIQQEIQIMEKLMHKNIIQFKGKKLINKIFYIIMEYCPLDCHDLLYQYFNNELPEEYIANGLKYLHQNKIIHRDIKLANILLQMTEEDFENFKNGQKHLIKKGTLKLTDFGISKQLPENQDFTKTYAGSDGLLAPEIFLSLEYGTEVDAFNLGIILYQLLTGEFPFEVDLSYITNVQKQNIDFGNISQKMKQYILNLLKFDPKDRLNVSELINELQKINKMIKIKKINQNNELLDQSEKCQNVSNKIQIINNGKNNNKNEFKDIDIEAEQLDDEQNLRKIIKIKQSFLEYIIENEQAQYIPIFNISQLKEIRNQYIQILWALTSLENVGFCLFLKLIISDSYRYLYEKAKFLHKQLEDKFQNDELFCIEAKEYRKQILIEDKLIFHFHNKFFNFSLVLHFIVFLIYFWVAMLQFIGQIFFKFKKVENQDNYNNIQLNVYNKSILSILNTLEKHPNKNKKQLLWSQILFSQLRNYQKQDTEFFYFQPDFYQISQNQLHQILSQEQK